MFELFRNRKNDPPDSSRDGVQGAETTPETQRTPRDNLDPQVLKEQVIAAIRTVYDPEIPVNVYDLGLIYDLEWTGDGDVKIQMTLTAPACPVAGSLPAEVERAVARVPGVGSARVELVWDPPWSAERMSEEARLELGLL
jgi:FeS assembly SUF system protein